MGLTHAVTSNTPIVCQIIIPSSYPLPTNGRIGYLDRDRYPLIQHEAVRQKLSHMFCIDVVNTGNATELFFQSCRIHIAIRYLDHIRLNHLRLYPNGYRLCIGMGIHRDRDGNEHTATDDLMA